MGENRGINGESEIVAERSGAETETPDHPLLRDPEPLEEPDEEAEAPEAEDSDMPEPEPEVGPAS